MSFVNLKKRFFVNNTVRAKNNIFYKESDPTTWVYDNYLNTKNIISLDFVNNINEFDFNDIEDSQAKKNKFTNVKSFFNNVLNPNKTFNVALSSSIYTDNDSQIFLSLPSMNIAKRINVLKSKTDFYSEINNTDICSFRFRNHFKVDKIRSKFLVDDPYIYKKNVIKNNLYKEYRAKNLDIYKDLEYGFCNYNTINFFSINQRNKHANSIIYANPISNQKHLYDFLNESFTISFKVIIRNKNFVSKPNCILHIPGLINVYIIDSLDDTVRIAVTTKEYTYKNILDIEEFQNRIYTTDIDVSTDFIFDKGLIVGTSNLNNLLINTWYNISLKFDKSLNKFSIFNNDKEYYKTTDLNIENIIGENNSYISIGNSIEYNNPVDTDIAFDVLFGKDGSIGTDGIDLYSCTNKDIFIPIAYENKTNIGNINTDDYISITSFESFHGELSDIRIYSTPIDDNLMKTFNDSYVKSIIDQNHLVFYVPVFYIPLEINSLQKFGIIEDKLQTSYNTYYNPSFSDTCGGLDISTENYLIEVIKCSKPNVVINGEEPESLYSHTYNSVFNVSNGVVDHQNHFIYKIVKDNDESFSKFKKGERFFEIYNNNFKEIILDDDIKSNYYYKNLMILPNDNGIPKVYFSVIKEFKDNNLKNLLTYNETTYKNIDGEILEYNISLENINNNNNFIFDVAKFNDTCTISNDISIYITDDLNNSRVLNCEEGNLGLNLFSSLLYHDSNLDSWSKLNYNAYNNEYFDPDKRELLNSSRNSYSLTDSNPSIRRVFKNNSFNDVKENYIKEIKNGIIYYRLPVPYSDINRDYDSNFISIFNIPKKFYNKKILRNEIHLKDKNFITGNSINLKDNGLGGIYRSDCNSKVAEWNYVGHVFYKEGIITLNNPIMSYFSDSYDSDFEITLKSESFLHIKEINVPADEGIINYSQNLSYNSDLKHNEASFNSEESFVYITDINLHDENFNIVSRAKLARPIPKKDSDKMIFKLKMDY